MSTAEQLHINDDQDTVAYVSGWIPKDHLALLRSKVSKLSRKAAKYGMPAFELSVGETKPMRWTATLYDADERLEYNREIVVDAVNVTITGEPPRLDGYRLLAKLDATADPQNAVVAYGGHQELPAPYSRGELPGLHCDHCATRRERRHLVLLKREDTGNLFQVGKECVKDYVGHQSASSMLHKASIIATVMKLVEEVEDGAFMGSKRPQALLDIRWVIAAAIEAIDKEGFISTEKAKDYGWISTAERVRTRIARMERNNGVEQFDVSVFEEANALLDWAREGDLRQRFDRGECNDFEGAIAFHSQFDTVGELSGVGVMAAAVNAYRQALTRTHSPGHFGELKQRVELSLTKERTIPISTAFGEAYIYVFRDEQGYRFKWKTQKVVEETTVRLRATIKDHTDYRGEPETVITRCTLL